MTFNSAREMLDYIQDGFDLYNPETGTYVFLYNGAGSICVYSISREEAEELKKKEYYWGAYLGAGGNIYDDPSYEYHTEDQMNNIQWCENCYNEEWKDVTK